MSKKKKLVYKDMEKTTEDNIVRSLGTGYLKVPEIVKQLIQKKYNKKVNELPAPETYYNTTKRKIRIMYVFDRSKIKEMK